MRLSTFSACALGAAAIAVLASCSGGNGAALAPLPSGSNAAAKASTEKLPFAYISDSLASSVTVFNTDGSFQRRIVHGIKNPAGITVDADHNLWVTNAGDGNVLEFARGGSKPVHVLDDPIAQAEPQDIAICPRGGIYVAGNDKIEVYAPGGTNPSRSLSYPQLQGVSSVTCDAKGNVFVIAVVYFHANVIEFPLGSRKGAKVLPIAGSPQGIRADAAGNILVGDAAAVTITEYTEAGKPTGHSIETTAGASCISFGVNGSGAVGCPVYIPYSTATTMGTSFNFPHDKPQLIFTSTLMAQPFGFAFDDQ